MGLCLDFPGLDGYQSIPSWRPCLRGVFTSNHLARVGLAVRNGSPPFASGISVIDGPFNEAKVTFNITSAPIEVKFVDLFGYGGSNPQVGTEASPILAVGTGFTLTTAIQEEHWMWVEVEPPVITGITGSCEQTAQLSVDPVYGINYNTWQDGLIAINCMHASTITISGGGFADGGPCPGLRRLAEG